MQQPQILKPNNSVYVIHKYDTLESTNTFLKEHYDSLPDYTVIWAEEQTTGRGRFTRTWDSIPGKDLTFSISLPLSISDYSYWPNITQVSALAIAELLEEYGLQLLIKWPNDVLVGQKKIGGILCEVVKRNKRPCAVLGIGLNINRTGETFGHIDLPATSVFNELQHEINRNKLLEKLIDKIILYFSEIAQKGFISFRDAIKRRLAYLHEQKTITGGKKTYTGEVLDINTNGTLLFKCNDGTVITLHSGELSFST